MDKQQTLLRQLYSHILGCAVSELFPSAQLIRGEATTLGFYHDFQFPFPFQELFLSQIEEKMRFVLREQRSLRLLEMTPKNASQLFLSREQEVLADLMRRSSSELVHIVEFGTFYDLGRSEPLPESYARASFKVLGFYTIGSAVRILGAVFLEKEALKSFVKAYGKEPFVDHETLSRELGWFGTERWLWYPEAEAFRLRWRDAWEGLHRKKNFKFLSTPGRAPTGKREDVGSAVTQAHVAYWLESNRMAQDPRLAEVAYVFGEVPLLTEGMLTPEGYYLDLAHLLPKEAELLKECISSLQFITKIPKILGFEFQVVLCVANAGTQKEVRLWKQGIELLRQALSSCDCEFGVEKSETVANGPRVEVRLIDALGRPWAGPFLRFDCHYSEVLGRPLLVRSLFGPWERMVALWIEQSRGAPSGAVFEMIEQEWH